MTTSPWNSLDPTAAIKPLDVGNGRVAGSVLADGRLTSLTGYVPSHGVGGLLSQAPYPDVDRGDATKVRAYRSAMADPQAAAFGLTPRQPWIDVAPATVAGVVARTHLRRDGMIATVTTVAPSGSHGLMQRWTLRRTKGSVTRWPYALTGPLWAGRAAMTQLTEGGVVEQPATDVVVSCDGTAVTVHNAAVPIAAAIVGLPVGSSPASWQRHAVGPVETRFEGTVLVPPDGVATLRLAVALAPDPGTAAERALALHAAPDAVMDEAVARWHGRWPAVDAHVDAALHPLVRRGLAYIAACCTLPVDVGTAVVTDHRILPLTWTRDAWWTVSALAAADDPDADALRGRHLAWLFSCDRPDGAWARAYLPTGRVKDPAFQLDQQCYPLLELADALAVAPGDADLRSYLDTVPEILTAIRRHGASAGVELFATDETPGDDPVPMPYHCSSHILLWHTLRRLARALDDADLEAQAAAVADAVRRHFVVRDRDAALFAYATDLDGGYVRYHDANDLPTAFAPRWGFCAPDDPVWQATMRFAFSERNAGWVPGRYGGLGSMHSPGAWPLGDVQELVWRRDTGDACGAEAVAARLAATACWDGALPEARDPDTGAVTSRHWFAWPGATLTVACLGF